MRSPRRFAGPLLVLAILLLPSASAQGDARDDLAVGIASAWPAQQRSDGRFGDALNGGEPMPRTRYAEAMLGYGLLQTGLRASRRDLVDAGLRGLEYAISRPYGTVRGGASVFENLAVAAAYNVAARRLRGDPAFEALRPAWVDWLRHVTALHVGDPAGLNNKHVVEAVVVLELCRSGVRSTVVGSILARCSAARAAVHRLLDTTLVRAVRVRRIGHGDAALLSDPPQNPLAYHGLTFGMLARAISLGGGHARARRLLAAMANASWALTAPDGDLAYVGRSNEQSWALALTAYGAQSGPLPTGIRQRAEAVAHRALRRLRGRYPIGPAGLAITPGLGRDPVGGALGVDAYAGAGIYNGLTLVALNWAAGQPRPTRGRLLADGNRGTVVGRGSDEMAVVRTRATWYAVKRRPGRGAREHDLRMDFGLMAFKRRTAAGHWIDVVGPPPISDRVGETAGPVLTIGRATGRAIGQRIRVDGNRVVVDGRFETRAGRVLRDHVRFTFRPVGHAIELRFRARRGDRIGLSAFLHSDAARVAGQALRDDTLSIGAGASARVATEPGYHSAVEPDLTRARLALRVRRTGPVTFLWTARGRR